MPTSAITVSNVSKRFRLQSDRRDSLRERFIQPRSRHHETFWALRDVSFEIPQGTTFGVIGHNGSGKSTLLKLIAGIHRPTAGSVACRGRISALLELGAGFHPELTGRENVYLNAAILGMNRRQADTCMDRIVDFAGVDKFFDSPIKIYSSGMVARLGFAIAINVDPEILLVDEVISVGDEEFQRKCMDHIHRLRQAGTTIVLVSHSLGQISELCNSAMWLENGRMRASGAADKVIMRYLEAVNQRASAVSDSADNDAIASDGRPGSGEIRIRTVEFIGSEGQPTSYLLSRTAGRIRIDYECTAPMADIAFGLAFFTEAGTRVAGPNSGVWPQAMAIEIGSGSIEFEVTDLLLQPGLYRVSAAVVARAHIVDHIEMGFELPVHATGAVTEPGIVRLPGQWRQLPMNR